MQQVVYGDVLFLVNFSIDLLVLFIAGCFLHIKRRPFRLVLASLIGGIYGVLILLPAISWFWTLISEDYFHNAPPFPFITFHDTEKALSLFYRTIDANTNKDSLAAKGYLTALLAMIIDDNFPDTIKKDIGNYTIANQIRDIIDSQQGLRHSLDDLESQLSYSKFYLERQFKNEYGISIIAYQNEKKFIEATRMLATKSISQVAAELGYSSIYSFSRAFKNKYGLSPSQYRQNTGK